MTWDDETGALAGDTTTEEGLVAAMERWHAQVKCAPSRPTGCSCGTPRRLGAAVRVPRGRVPAEPMPRLNDTHAFREGIIGGALTSQRLVGRARAARQKACTAPSLETGS